MLIASSGNYSPYQKTEVQNGYGSQTEQKKIVPAVMKLSKGSGFHPQPAINKVNTGTTEDCNLPWAINLSQSSLLNAII